MEIDEPTEAVPGAYLTGAIGRVTEYEQVPAVFLLSVRKAGARCSGEQAFVFSSKTGGSSCSPAAPMRGIVNTVKHAMGMAGASPSPCA